MTPYCIRIALPTNKQTWWHAVPQPRRATSCLSVVNKLWTANHCFIDHQLNFNSWSAHAATVAPNQLTLGLNLKINKMDFSDCPPLKSWEKLIYPAQLFEKASSRNIKLKFFAFNMQWLFGSILERTTKMIFLDTFCSQNLPFFSWWQIIC